MTVGPSPYDLVPYPGVSIPATRPDRVALASRRMGGPAPLLKAPRVLEIGCGDGANVLGLGYYRRASTVIGVDASLRHVEAALAGARALDLDPERVRFHHADASESGWEPRQPVDVIIAHGFFSWVDDPTASAFLDLCRRRLTPNGLAYISYNVLPGWRVRGIVRDTLLAAVEGETRHQERGHLAMDVAKQLHGMLEDGEHPYHRLLAHELELALRYGADYILYDHLNPDNRAFYFDAFRKRVEEHGLRYVADASFNRAEGVSPERVAEVAEQGLPLDPERVIDVLGMRQFRTSIVCRDDAVDGDQLGRSDLDDMVLATDLAVCHGSESAAHVDAPDAEGRLFAAPDGEEVRIQGALPEAGLQVLVEAGIRGLPFADLERRALAACHESGEEPGEEGRGLLRDTLLGLWGQDLVDLRVGDGFVPEGASGAPHGLAAWEAEHSGFLTTPDHELIHLEPTEIDPFVAWARGGPPPDEHAVRRFGAVGLLA